jgi:hypothetical protein
VPGGVLNSATIVGMWLGTAAAIIASVSVVANRALMSQARADKAGLQLAQARTDASILSDAATWLRVIETPGDQSQGLAAWVSGCLRDAGLPIASLVTVSPEQAQAGLGRGASGVVKQQATLTLNGLTLPQVGSLLALWRGRSQRWTVTAIDISPMPSAGAPVSGSIGADLPLRIHLTLESISVQGVLP